MKRKGYKDIDKWRKANNAQRKRYYQKSQNAKNSKKPWTQRDIDLVMEHKMLDSELSKLIGRSVLAIQRMRCKQKKRKESSVQ